MWFSSSIILIYIYILFVVNILFKKDGCSYIAASKKTFILKYTSSTLRLYPGQKPLGHHSIVYDFLFTCNSLNLMSKQFLMPPPPPSPHSVLKLRIYTGNFQHWIGWGGKRPLWIKLKPINVQVSQYLCP